MDWDFLVRILGWDGVVTDQHVFYDTVRRLKPAHTRAVYECECLATWDDWELGEAAKPLGGVFQSGVPFLRHDTPGSARLTVRNAPMNRGAWMARRRVGSPRRMEIRRRGVPCRARP